MAIIRKKKYIFTLLAILTLLGCMSILSNAFAAGLENGAQEIPLGEELLNSVDSIEVLVSCTATINGNDSNEETIRRRITLNRCPNIFPAEAELRPFFSTEDCQSGDKDASASVPVGTYSNGLQQEIALGLYLIPSGYGIAGLSIRLVDNGHQIASAGFGGARLSMAYDGTLGLGFSALDYLIYGHCYFFPHAPQSSVVN